MNRQKITITVASSLFTIFISIIGGLFVWWLNDYVNRPQIDWYSRSHYKVEDFAIGNIYLTNSGRITDTNIAITLDASLKEEDIKIVDLTSDYLIKNDDGKTIIKIAELKPGEGADISYRDRENRDDIAIVGMVSNYGNFHFAFDKHWWDFSPPIEVILVILLLITGSVGGFLFKSRFEF
ncbi:MAG: hypothetical protein WA058_03755 [Minisyncoccia bacterium]